jgi:hypothetical protein
MRIEVYENGYTIWLSAYDTYEWAHKPDAWWPCSTLSDKRFMAVVDANGLCDLTVNGRDAPDTIDGAELDAIVADHLPKNARQFWPVWDLEARP